MEEKKSIGDFIDPHRHSVHTPESWGRTITKHLFSVAQTEMAQSGIKNKITIPVEIFVTAYQCPECLHICVDLGGGAVYHHIVC